jgi:threonine/homoserine/homoserine lactone efflux protein
MGVSRNRGELTTIPDARGVWDAVPSRVLAAFLIALVLSFVGSMPIAGPIAVVVLSKGLDNRPRSGLFVAIGAALAESVYAGLAFLGLTAALERYPLLIPISRITGCAILIGLGVYFIVRKPKKQEEKKEEKKEDAAATTAFRSFFLGLSVTALNPTLIVTWTAAVSAAQSTGLLRVSEIDALPFGLGVLSGIISWFATLLWLLTRFRKKLRPESMDRMIRGMGIVLVLAGVAFALRTALVWHATH